MGESYLTRYVRPPLWTPRSRPLSPPPFLLPSLPLQIESFLLSPPWYFGQETWQWINGMHQKKQRENSSNSVVLFDRLRCSLSRSSRNTWQDRCRQGGKRRSRKGSLLSLEWGGTVVFDQWMLSLGWEAWPTEVMNCVRGRMAQPAKCLNAIKEHFKHQQIEKILAPRDNIKQSAGLST